MGLVTWIVIGGLAGLLAKLLVPGEDPGGVIVTILIGIVGAFVGGVVVGLFGGGGVTGFNVGSILTAVLGAVLLLLAYRAIAKRVT
jgi:uncharacterized membrane protein YeaQ/YmgE (transglycosylase-associated protein family)